MEVMHGTPEGGSFHFISPATSTESAHNDHGTSSLRDHTNTALKARPEFEKYIWVLTAKPRLNCAAEAELWFECSAPCSRKVRVGEGNEGLLLVLGNSCFSRWRN